MGDVHDDLDLQATRPKLPQPAPGPSADVSRSTDGPPSDHASLLELQRLAGNASVSRLVARQPADDSEEAAGDGGRSPVLDVVGRGGGEPLEGGLRAEMESRLGADFGDVRIHRDGTASESARAVDANAYTVGRDVVFRSDRWDPASSDGKRTLAHELSHVVQQAAGPVAGSPAPGGINVSSPDDPFERAAERAADAAMSGPSPSTDTPSAAPAVGTSAQLQVADEEEELEEEEETAQGDWVQRQGDEEEEELEEEIPDGL